MSAIEHTLHAATIVLGFLTVVSGFVFVASDFGSKQCLSIRTLLTMFSLCLGAFSISDYLSYIHSDGPWDAARMLMTISILTLESVILATVAGFLYSYYRKASSSLGYNVFLADMAVTKSQRAAIRSKDYVNIGG